MLIVFLMQAVQVTLHRLSLRVCLGHRTESSKGDASWSSSAEFARLWFSHFLNMK